MNWDMYTIFSVLSGIILLACAVLVRALSMTDRAWFSVGGIFLAAYGLFVANQTSGTYYFSVWIFIIPVGAVAYAFGLPVLKASQRADASGAQQPVPLTGDAVPFTAEHEPRHAHGSEQTDLGGAVLETPAAVSAQTTTPPEQMFRREAGESHDHAVRRLLRTYWARYQVGEPFGPGLGFERAVQKVSLALADHPSELPRLSELHLASLMEEVRTGRVAYDDWDTVLGLRWSIYSNQYIRRAGFQAVSRSVATLKELGAEQASGRGDLLERWRIDADFQCEVLVWAIVILGRLGEAGKLRTLRGADVPVLADETLTPAGKSRSGVR